MIGVNASAVVVWIAPDGRQLHLSGGAEERREGVSLDRGLAGVSGLSATPAFQSAGKQVGETVTGWEFGHGEIDLPLTILGESRSHMVRTREVVKGMFSRDKPGWLCVYQPANGWRWTRCRLRSMIADVGSSPHLLGRVGLDIVLIAEDPRAETRPYSSQWRNSSGAGHGTLRLYPGPEWRGWPSFYIHGPGAVTLSVHGSTIELPHLAAGERCLLHSDPTVGVLRSVDADGRSTNRWPDVVGYLEQPLPTDEVSRVDIRVTGGNTDTAVAARVRSYREGLL